MNKNYLLSIFITQNPKWHLLFWVIFVLLFSVNFQKSKAQCPVIALSPLASTLCSGSKTSLILKSNLIGTTFSWTTVQDGVAGAVDGAGAYISNTLITTDNSEGSVVYSITPVANGCKGNPAIVKIAVIPIPVITAKPLTSSIVSNSEASIALTSDVAETVFSWTVIQSGISGAKNGSGSLINQFLSATANKGIATYRITPDFKGCAGKSINAKVIVKKGF